MTDKTMCQNEQVQMKKSMTRLRIQGALYLSVGLVLQVFDAIDEKPIITLVVFAILLELFGLFMCWAGARVGDWGRASQGRLILMGCIWLLPVLPIQWITMSTLGAGGYVGYLIGVVAGMCLFAPIKVEGVKP
ncbi:MAG: hypothetical protein ABJA67_14155 [Chthonomonadales bacterium]